MSNEWFDLDDPKPEHPEPAPEHFPEPSEPAPAQSPWNDNWDDDLPARIEPTEPWPEPSGGDRKIR